KYAYPGADGLRQLRLCWQQRGRDESSDWERHRQADLPAAEEPRAVFIPLNDTITDFRIYPDYKTADQKPCVFRLEQIGLLVGPDDYAHFAQEYEDWQYRDMVRRVCRDVSAAVPAGATVLVFSHGDDDLLRLPGRTGWHFPQTAGGVYDKSKPADSARA